MSTGSLQTTAAVTAGLERIPDQLGYLVISEDGVLAVSDGASCQKPTAHRVATVCELCPDLHLFVHCCKDDRQPMVTKTFSCRHHIL